MYKSLRLTLAAAMACLLCMVGQAIAEDADWVRIMPKETDEMIGLVRKIRDQGVTLFIIEHVMQAVMSLSERIALLHHGEKILEGTPQEVATDERAIKAYLGEEYVVARG